MGWKSERSSDGPPPKRSLSTRVLGSDPTAMKPTIDLVKRRYLGSSSVGAAVVFFCCWFWGWGDGIDVRDFFKTDNFSRYLGV